jgi:transposase
MKVRNESNTLSPAVIGVDIGKDVFHLVGFDAGGKIVFRRRIRRLGLKDAFEKLPPCIVGMEACLSAHFVSRTLRVMGHEPRIIPAIYVKPFVKGQKNDYNVPRRLPKQRCDRTCGLSRKRARISWTCRLAIGCDRDWSPGEPQRSTKFAPF